MRGNRGARGFSNRNTAIVSGENYTGDAAGVSTAWGGGSAGASTPAVGVAPTVTVVYEENDEGGDTVDSKQSTPTRNTAPDSTKSRLRTQFKTLANFIAWIMKVIAGTLTAKIIQIDGAGGNAPPVNGCNFAVSAGASHLHQLGIGSTGPLEGNTTLTATSPTLVLVDTHLGAVEIKLPVASSSPTNPLFIIKDLGGAAVHNVTVSVQGSDTIDGSGSSKVINSDYGVFRIVRISANGWGEF